MKEIRLNRNEKFNIIVEDCDSEIYLNGCFITDIKSEVLQNDWNIQVVTTYSHTVTISAQDLSWNQVESEYGVRRLCNSDTFQKIW